MLKKTTTYEFSIGHVDIIAKEGDDVRFSCSGEGEFFFLNWEGFEQLYENMKEIFNEPIAKEAQSIEVVNNAPIIIPERMFAPALMDADAARHM